MAKVTTVVRLDKAEVDAAILGAAKVQVNGQIGGSHIGRLDDGGALVEFTWGRPPKSADQLGKEVKS